MGGLEINCYRARPRVHSNIGMMMDVINGCDEDRYILYFSQSPWINDKHPFKASNFPIVSPFSDWNGVVCIVHVGQCADEMHSFYIVQPLDVTYGDPIS